jgi:hypothetical protein
MMSADSCIIDTDIVVREPADGLPLFGHVVLGQHLPVEAENQTRHYFPRVIPQ